MPILLKNITVRDYRCFEGSQSARLAPVTVLVGENSSGKTSLLALIRALWDISLGAQHPDFQEEPYDLGTFDEIAHRRTVNGQQPDQFEAGIEFAARDPDPVSHDSNYRVDVTFGPQFGGPTVRRQRISQGDYSVEIQFDERGRSNIYCTTPRGMWKVTDLPDDFRPLAHKLDYFNLVLLAIEKGKGFEPRAHMFGAPQHITETDIRGFRIRLVDNFALLRRLAGDPTVRPYASGPVQSHPKRTYNPSPPVADPRGEHVPMYLAQLSRSDPHAWAVLKERLEGFGRNAGLFDRIEVLHLGADRSAPFQIRLFMEGVENGLSHNLADVGYGVSQILPYITDILRHDGPPIFLMQEPEAHLHPRARVALGQLLCKAVADPSYHRQMVIETHSDFIVNRVRMAARDDTVGLQPEDISILYLERNDHGVRVHSLSVDNDGNLLNTPPGYRRFFREESEWFLGF